MRQKARTAPIVEYRPEPVVEYRVGSRVALAPSAIPHIAAWVMTLRDRYDRQARMTLRGLSGRARIMRRGQIESAKLMCRAIDDLATSLSQTVDMGMFERCLMAIQAVMAESAGGGAAWPLQSD